MHALGSACLVPAWTTCRRWRAALTTARLLMWVSEDIKFLPMCDCSAKSPGHKREEAVDKAETMAGAYVSYDPFSVQPFVEGISEYYK